MRIGAPNTILGAGLPLIDPYASDAEALRLAGELVRNMGVDILYASGLIVERFAALGRQRFPRVGHVGYLPSRSTWFGGSRAVGKTTEEAMRVYEHVLAFAAAGVIGVEIELVPREVAAEITRRVKSGSSVGSGSARPLSGSSHRHPANQPWRPTPRARPSASQNARFTPAT